MTNTTNTSMVFFYLYLFPIFLQKSLKVLIEFMFKHLNK